MLKSQNTSLYFLCNSYEENDIDFGIFQSYKLVFIHNNYIDIYYHSPEIIKICNTHKYYYSEIFIEKSYLKYFSFLSQITKKEQHIYYVYR